MSFEKEFRKTMEVDEKPKPTFQSCITKQVFAESSTKPSQPFNSCFSDAVPKKDDSIKDDENNEDDDYLDSFPPGYRFCPLDEELIIHYLKKKVMNEPLPCNRITEVNLYRHNPETLAEQYKQYGEKEWYFFTPRDKKYRNGTRPNRAAGDGYWKATGADREIKFRDHIVGYRKALVFYRGKPPKGDKTNWIMHEYRVNDPPPCNTVYNDMRLDDWVLCRIYKKVDKSVGTRLKDNSRSQLIQKEDTKAMDLDYNNANSIEYSNDIGGYVQQSFSDESFYNYGDDKFSTLLYETHGIESRIADSYHFIAGQDDIWSAENFDFPSQPLDFNGGNVEPPIILDNILRDDTPKKDPTNSGGIEE